MAGVRLSANTYEFTIGDTTTALWIAHELQALGILTLSQHIRERTGASKPDLVTIGVDMTDSLWLARALEHLMADGTIEEVPVRAEELIASYGSIEYQVTDESGNDYGLYTSRTMRYAEGERLVTAAGEWTVIDESTEETPGRLVVAPVS